MTGLDFEGLAVALLARSGELVMSWLPGGRMEGREYVCGDIRGGPGDSFKVNLNTGRWADFSNDQKGGDLISLYAAIENIKQGDAAKQLADRIGFRLSDGYGVRASHVEQKLGPPPPEVSAPTMLHPKFGPPSMTWTYRAANGQVLFYVARYDPPEGKQFCPWSWSETNGRWVAKGWPAPRPLYGLDRLAAEPDKYVLVVEGEKAADAAREITAGVYVVVTWPNGSKAARKADFSPLYGKKVLFWADADEPGIKAMQEVAEILLPHCPEIKMLEVTR